MGRPKSSLRTAVWLRLAPDSSLTLAVLRGAGASADAEMALTTGLAYFEFQGGGLAGQMRVRFGSSVATTSGFTALRVAMDTPPGSLAVFSGNVHIEIAAATAAAPCSRSPWRRRHRARSRRPESILSRRIDRAELVGRVELRPRQALTAEAAAQTEAPANLGETGNPAWNDLDANGSWYDVPGQGYVWSPYDAAERRLRSLRQRRMDVDAGLRLPVGVRLPVGIHALPVRSVELL